MIGSWTRRGALAAIGAAGLLPALARAQPRGDFHEPRGEEVLDYLGLEHLRDSYR